MLWFHDIRKGNVDTELVCLRLENERFGVFSGQGFLTWNPENGVEIRALTDGGAALSGDSFSHLQMPLGSLTPPSEYLRLTANTRAGETIVAERLHFTGYDYHSGNESVAWRINRSQILSTIDFHKGQFGEKADSFSFLLSNGGRIVWPRISPANQWCLEFQCALGKVTAYDIRGEQVLINIESESPQDITKVVDAVSFAFCFWAGKILPVIAYEVRHEDAIRCRLFRPVKLNNVGEAPPFGHMILLGLETYHEVLLQRAMDFFTQNNDRIGSLIHTRLSVPEAPFSIGILVLCSALEGIAKEVAKANPVGQEIPSEVKCKVESCFRESGLPDDMATRFTAFASKVNAPTAANAISAWCKSGFLGFDAADKKAWDFRNKSAHGNFSLYGGDFTSRKGSVANRDRLANMVNKLVMHAIGYEGKYLDYGTHSEQDFPPKPPAAPESTDAGS